MIDKNTTPAQYMEILRKSNKDVVYYTLRKLKTIVGYLHSKGFSDKVVADLLMRGALAEVLNRFDYDDK